MRRGKTHGFHLLLNVVGDYCAMNGIFQGIEFRMSDWQTDLCGKCGAENDSSRRIDLRLKTERESALLVS